ncbi:alpha/beta hydrolase [Brumimicrobium glaciale]|uniref:Alpha/beta hydrolase n=1 Tax=Brumimicrobium glaciale TaxID=200475 RepID=A0A4Q4KKV0_9FLAO|nr:alpha/beta hydrolase [Brumimicrobium glaciale]RYM33347.1 alpha/beta hydrolase [Brumimicrobium glaciale]
MKHLKWLVLVALFLSTSLFSWSQKEKEVNVKIEKGTIYGNLISVENYKENPVVIIIPGSGPTDRNGNNPFMQPNTYKLLTKELAKNGISSLRYDKLMIGESKNDLSEKDLLFEDNVHQVTAWIDYLEKKKFTNIVILGHSEGSLIGMLAAQERKVSKFISLCGTGRTIDVVLAEQIAKQSPQYSKEIEKLLEKLKNGEEVTEFSPELAGLFRTDVQPYVISWLKYSPKEEIGKLNIPVLIIHGSTDIQVTAEDAKIQKEGNPKAELKIIEGMNHVLKVAPEDKDENMKTYYDPKLPLHEELVPVIIEFIIPFNNALTK